jgi:hypothetical protein
LDQTGGEHSNTADYQSEARFKSSAAKVGNPPRYLPSITALRCPKPVPYALTLLGPIERIVSVNEVILTEPIEGARAEIVEPSQLGGTRHLSAAQFIRDQHDAVALVASQDGRFTVFAWSPFENMVRAHRIEVLLL